MANTLKMYKVSAPVGVTVIPKEKMTETELRYFCVTLIQDTDEAPKTWEEKVRKDPVSDIIEWLTMQGYTVSEA